MEKNKIVVSLKNGMIWTQIFCKKGEIVSSYVSDDEYEALTKAKKFLREHPDILVANPKRKW
jgi:hypothetical protein